MRSTETQAMSDVQPILEFAPFALDLERGELRRDGVPVAIHATPLRLLMFLVEHRDRTVSKEELLSRVWPDSFVGENALTSAICELRQALADDGTRQAAIRTERGRGYRFIPELKQLAPALPAAWKVAVLPFADLSPRGDLEHLADGLTEELIHTLSGLADLSVVSRTSCFAFKRRNEDVRRIGAELGVGTLVEGSIRASGRRARVTAQMVRASDGHQLWSQTYDRRIDDALDLEQEIAGEVAAAVERQLTPSEVVRIPHQAPRALHA